MAFEMSFIEVPNGVVNENRTRVVRLLLDQFAALLV